MIEDHDSGDEDRRDIGHESCPLCGLAMRHRQTWQTPVTAWRPGMYDFAFMAATPSPSERWDGEVLTTCVSCKLVAREFARLQHMHPLEKVMRARIVRWGGVP